MNKFKTVALEMYPEIATSGVITRKQAHDVFETHKHSGIKWPQSLINKENSVSRGVFNFSANFETDSTISLIKTIVETDEELDTRISETYETLDTLVNSVAHNKVNSLILAGAAGLGKSYEVNKILNQINNGEYGYIFHRGYLKATHLFRLLWENKEKGQTIVIDDSDAVFSDETALNILKAALELKPSRTVAWGSEKVFLDDDGQEIPRYFQYQGNVIFLTNLPFSDMASGNSKNAPHLAALESRSLVLDLKIRTKREILVKIKQTVKQGMLNDKDLSKHEQDEVVAFVVDNADKMKELSLRSVEKLAVLVSMDRTGWKKLARTVMLR